MSKSRRGITALLVLLGMAVALIVLASMFGGPFSAVSASLALVTLLAYLGLVLGILANISLATVRLSVPNIAAATKVTPAARKAVQRARARSDYASDATLTDVGLIVNERIGGQLSRHIAQAISMDNDAVQPYVTIHALRANSDRLALIKFDIYDHTGKQRFTRQCEQWIRDGDNLVVCDRQLPLEAQEALRSGIWDLHVTIDGTVAALHSFTVTPASAERQRRPVNLEGEISARDRDLSVPGEDAPVSLEDLLREQRAGQSGRTSSSSNRR